MPILSVDQLRQSSSLMVGGTFNILNYVCDFLTIRL